MFIQLFNLFPLGVVCQSACTNLTRENVKWCVRIADMDRNIETCVSLNGTQEVFESTCEAELLDLKKHLRLPDVRSCKNIIYMHTLIVPFSSQSDGCSTLFSSSGCLTLTNVGWFFREAYLTCITDNGSCSDINFVHAQTFGK